MAVLMPTTDKAQGHEKDKLPQPFFGTDSNQHGRAKLTGRNEP